MVKIHLCTDDNSELEFSGKLKAFYGNHASVNIDNIIDNISEFITDPLILQGVIDELRNARDRGISAFLEAVEHDLGDHQ